MSFYSKFSSIIFLMLAILSSSRIIYNCDLIVADKLIPMEVNWVLSVLFYLLFLFGLNDERNTAIKVEIINKKDDLVIKPS